MKMTHDIDWFYKYPADVFTIEYDFTNDLSTGDTLNTCTASIYNSENTDKTASMISNTTASSPDVTFDISSGTGGETYSIKVVGVTTNSKKFTHYISCEVFGVLTLNTKLGDINANSYVTVKEANDYIRNKYGHSNDWDTINDEGKKRILIQAADDIEVFNYLGEKYYNAQRLQFPRDDHSVVTGNCATPLGVDTFKNSGLYSTTYGEMPTDYWKYGTVHITSATPLYEVRNISTSNSSTGAVTLSEDFSASPTANTQFVAFEPLHKEVKDAQCEQSLFIVQNSRIDTIQDYRAMGVRRVEMGDTRLDFSIGAVSHIAISGKVRKLLGRWIRKSLRVSRA